MTKRKAWNRSSSNDILSIDVRTILGGKSPTYFVTPFRSMNDVLNENTVVSSKFDANVLANVMVQSTAGCPTSACGIKESTEATTIPKSMSVGVQLTEIHSAETLESCSRGGQIGAHASMIADCYALPIGTCIWPVGVSQQPDFIEIVVTDEEMNAYWDTVKDCF